MRPRGAGFPVTFLLFSVRNVTLLLLVPLFSLSTAPAFSQSTAPVWERFYGSGAANPEDRAYDAATDADGNLYVTGYSAVTGTHADFLTVKFDAEGNVLWSARHDISYADLAHTIALGPDGSVYVSGSSWDEASGYGVVTVRYNADGKKRWAAQFKGYGRDVSLAVAKNGSLYVPLRRSASSWWGRALPTRQVRHRRTSIVANRSCHERAPRYSVVRYPPGC